MKIIIDRIEAEQIIAELPDGQTVRTPRALFSDAEKGDVYEIGKSESDTIARKFLMELGIDQIILD